MLGALVRRLPIGCFDPLRRGAVSLRRGSLPRSLCIGVLKIAAGAHGSGLAARIDAVRPLDAPGIRFRAVDSMVMDAVYWFGVQGYEGRAVEVWTGLCRTARSVLEVGGNVGLFTVLGGRAAGGLYTVVEPVPEVAAVLRDNLRLNGIDRVEVLEAAAIAASAPAEMTLSIPTEGRAAPVGSHLVGDVEVSGRASARQIKVAGLPFAALFAGRDLIKIDAEGIEADLLGAVRDAIIRDRPTLMIELLPTATRLAALLAELAEAASYTVWIIPAWGSDTIVRVPAGALTADLPARHRSKDVVLSAIDLPAARG